MLFKFNTEHALIFFLGGLILHSTLTRLVQLKTLTLDISFRYDLVAKVEIGGLATRIINLRRTEAKYTGTKRMDLTSGKKLWA